MPDASQARRLRRLVLHERPELAPTRRALDQRDLTGGDAAEPNPHRQRHDMQAVQQIRAGRRHCW